MVLERQRGALGFKYNFRILWPLEGVVIAELIQQVAIMSVGEAGLA